MSVPVITFFNNKGGVGKTSLVYHVAWMMSDLGLNVLAADLDPQCNLSAAFLEDEQLEELWSENRKDPVTIHRAIYPLKSGVGDVAEPWLQEVKDDLVLLPGDMALSEFEDDLSQVWPKCLDGDARAFRVMSSFWRVLQKSARSRQAKIILVDLGPNLGAINRAVLIASDYVIIPLGPDLFSLQGLRNLGPVLARWRKGWGERRAKNPDPEAIELPGGKMEAMGYIVMQPSMRLDRPVRAYEKWISRMPGAYREDVLNQKVEKAHNVKSDRNCLAILKHYRSLMPMAQEARKPMFKLKPADGALGSHLQSAKSAYDDFKTLSLKILDRLHMTIP